VNESDHKRNLVAEINALRGGRARRIEDRWAIGVLDLIVKLPDLPVIFAEGKIIAGHKFGPTERQFIEGNRWIAAGVGVVLIGWKDKTMSVSPWTSQADWRDCLTASNDVSTLIEYFRLAGYSERPHWRTAT
jgi:hypothetical protein